jgi:Rrf2 family nitric oxide-sensitive transcriptional repressor
MQLSLHADYAFRVLIYVATHPDETVTTVQISQAYGISRNHLVRVVRTLGDSGYLKLMPGRSGGMRLARDPDSIRLGEVVRQAEPHLRLVECFDKETNTCPIVSACALKAWLKDGMHAFLAELDRHTLAELMLEQKSRPLKKLFQIGASTVEPDTPKSKTSPAHRSR